MSDRYLGDLTWRFQPLAWQFSVTVISGMAAIFEAGSRSWPPATMPTIG
jgi:hypothetical protein